MLHQIVMTGMLHFMIVRSSTVPYYALAHILDTDASHDTPRFTEFITGRDSFVCYKFIRKKLHDLTQSNSRVFRS